MVIDGLVLDSLRVPLSMLPVPTRSIRTDAMITCERSLTTIAAWLGRILHMTTAFTVPTSRTCRELVRAVRPSFREYLTLVHCNCRRLHGSRVRLVLTANCIAFDGKPAGVRRFPSYGCRRRDEAACPSMGYRPMPVQTRRCQCPETLDSAMTNRH